MAEVDDDLNPGAFLDALFFDPSSNDQTWLYYPYNDRELVDLEEWLKSVRIGTNNIEKQIVGQSEISPRNDSKFRRLPQELFAGPQSPEVFGEELSSVESPAAGLAYDSRTFTRPKKINKNFSVETCSLLENVSIPWKNETWTEISSCQPDQSITSTRSINSGPIVGDTFTLSQSRNSSNHTFDVSHQDPITSENFRPFKASTPASRSNRLRKIQTPSKSRQINENMFHCTEKNAEVHGPKEYTINVDEMEKNCKLENIAVSSPNNNYPDTQSSACVHILNTTFSNNNAEVTDPKDYTSSVDEIEKNCQQEDTESLACVNNNLNTTFSCLNSHSKNLSKSDSNLLESPELIPLTNQLFECADYKSDSSEKRKTASSFLINKNGSHTQQTTGLTSRVPLLPPSLKSKSNLSTSSLDVSTSLSSRIPLLPHSLRSKSTFSTSSIDVSTKCSSSSNDKYFIKPSGTKRSSMSSLTSLKDQASDQKATNTTITKASASGIPRPTSSRIPVLRSQLPVGRFRKPPSTE